MTVAIRFDHVTKVYRLHKQQPFLAREILRNLLQRPSSIEEHMALREASFEIQQGESVAVVGRNGAGKSTLLSMVAGTVYPTSGKVTVVGRVGPLLELGAGFHSDLTGRENIRLNGVLLGLSPEQVDARYDDIAEYAELGTFIDAPISTYSVGMRARLGFSVIAHLDPDVLILDEVLGVGDARFKEKCTKTLRELHAQGKTIFVVSHSVRPLKELCNKALWIEQGQVRAFGKAEEILPLYEGFMTGKTELPPPISKANESSVR